MMRLLLLVALAAAGDHGAAIDEHLGARVPGDLTFTDQDGRAVHLRDALAGGKPVLLVLAYYHCPMLCDLVLSGVAAAVGHQGLHLGTDFRALTVSFDPADTAADAARKQQRILEEAGVAGARASWPFWVGAADQSRALADAVGFRYRRDPATGMFAHPACAIVLTPDGRVARYLYGVRFPALDLRLALAEAGGGKVGGIVDRVLLTCFHYDPTTRRYGFVITAFVKGGAVLILAGLLVGALYMRRLERRRRSAP